MGLDWFTLIAQVLNFLVLVWLLKHFLFGRIVHAMNEREAKIASRLEEAAQQRALAEREASLYHAKNREWEEQREQMLAKLEEEAQAHRQQVMEAARRDAHTAQLEWHETLRRERQDVLQAFRERLGEQVLAVTRQGLQELADADLEQQIVKVFLDRLEALDPGERQAIVTALRNSNGEIEVRTAFPMSPAARERLTLSLRQQFDDQLDVRFHTAKELICGIELRADAHRFVWNLDSYLEGLEARLFDALDENATKHASPR